MQRKTVHLATLADEGFRLGLAVMLRSALARLGPESALSIHVLDLGLSSTSREKICKTVKSADEHSEVRFLPWKECSSATALEASLQTLELRKYAAICFAKLVLFEELKTVPWCLYLDADIYVNRDLAALPIPSLHDLPLAAINDEGMAPLVAKGAVPEFMAMKLDASAPHFNGGVMLLNLDDWREERRFDRALEIATALRVWSPDNPAINWALTDQAVLNVIYHRRWTPLPVDWNRQCPADYGLFNDIREGRERLLHYIGNPKPWNTPLSAATEPFFDCLDQTAYAGWRPAKGWSHVRRRLSWLKYRFAKLRDDMRRKGEAVNNGRG